MELEELHDTQDEEEEPVDDDEPVDDEDDDEEEDEEEVNSQICDVTSLIDVPCKMTVEFAHLLAAAAAAATSTTGNCRVCVCV